MGSSYWFDCMAKPDPGGQFFCNPAPKDPFQPVPVPLLANYTTIAQPAGLFTIAKRYASAAVDFITTSATNRQPFFLYFPFNHVSDGDPLPASRASTSMYWASEAHPGEIPMLCA